MSLETVIAEQVTWESSCPEAITSDSLWTLDAYRAALYLLDVARRDTRAMRRHHAAPGLRNQLLTSTGSVSANLAEGYSRSTRADRLRFYDYALGSARETVTWYYAAADYLSPSTFGDRLLLVARVRSILLGLIRSTRSRASRKRFEL
jgi:four helix bundle protein